MSRLISNASTSRSSTTLQNPKIIHRIYFANFRPYRDPFLHFRDTWRRELPDYKIMDCNASNLNVLENEWTRRALQDKSPVFLSEYFRWKLLAEFGGVYLDADCEILDGKGLSRIIDELYSQPDYDVFFGVEERQNGHPTAQTVGARPGSDLVAYMLRLYNDHLPPLWEWREKRGLLGPALMSLYFLDRKINVEHDGFFKGMDEPVVMGRAKVYPQQYFSPKFSLTGDKINFKKGETCVYHMFANSNLDFATQANSAKVRQEALTFDAYSKRLSQAVKFPRRYDAAHLTTRVGRYTDDGVVAGGQDGLLSYGPYVSLPRGSYQAEIECDRTPTRGAVTLSVTEGGGRTTLATRRVSYVEHLAPHLAIDFEVADDFATDVEFPITIDGVDDIRIRSVVVHERKRRETAAVAPGSLKILHRIYFGFDGKPDQFGRYLETWQEQLPDFKIVHWNSSNLPMDINPYVRELFKLKDHAFLTDFFRWYVLREYGGVYLDADVEVVDGALFGTLVSELEGDDSLDAFIGIDEKGGGWYTAHSMASKANSEIATFMCDLYANFGKFTAWRKRGMYFWAPQLVGLYFANQGHHEAGMGTTPHLDEPIVVNRVKVYPQDWFSPLSPSGDAETPFVLNGLSEHTCLCHHFACSWHDESSPYAIHSRARGGQASALLQDIVAPGDERRAPVRPPRSTVTPPAKTPPSRSWRTAVEVRIQTNVGVRDAEGISTNGKEGCVLYGPYVPLPGGDYEVRMSLRPGARIGRLSADVVCNSGNTVLFRGQPRWNAASERLEFKFRVGTDAPDVEFRLFTDKKSEFCVREIAVVKAGD